jgi:hypothetical protein
MRATETTRPASPIEVRRLPFDHRVGAHGDRLRGLQVDTSPNLATGHATTTDTSHRVCRRAKVRTAIVINDAPSPSCCPRVQDSTSDPLRSALQQMLVYDLCTSGSSVATYCRRSQAWRANGTTYRTTAWPCTDHHTCKENVRRIAATEDEDLIHECYGSSDFKKEDEPSWGSGVLYGW